MLVVNGAPVERTLRLVSRSPRSRRDHGARACSIYVLGDNRAESEDSRTWGPIDEDAIIGKAIVGSVAAGSAQVMSQNIPHDNAPQIQWFPGHMVKAMRLLEERLALVDVVIEVLDARLPLMSSNPELDRIVGTRPRLVILGRDDLADPFATRRWLTWYYAERKHRHAVAIDGRIQPSVNHGRGANSTASWPGAGPSRAIVIGLPNTGKSSLINGLANDRRKDGEQGRRHASATLDPRECRTGSDGYTGHSRARKIPTDEAQWMLAITGALPRERYDRGRRRRALCAGRTSTLPKLAVPDLETFARQRGFVRKGDDDSTRTMPRAPTCARSATGKFGRITFEQPPEAVA